MSAETNVDAGLLRGDSSPVHPRPRWVTALFVVLLLIDLAPIVLLGLMGRWTREAWQDPSFPPAVALVCAAPLVALAGVLGSRRGWNGGVLSFLALLTIAWQLFVAWVLINVMFAPL